MSEITSVSSASQIQMDYMKLLVTQLQNQNPLEPMDNQEMASQLAQFSQLSQLEQINDKLGSSNSKFDEILAQSRKSYAESLTGKQISFAVESESETGQAEVAVEKVSKVLYDQSKDEYMLQAGDYYLPVSSIIAVGQ